MYENSELKTTTDLTKSGFHLGVGEDDVKTVKFWLIKRLPFEINFLWLL